MRVILGPYSGYMVPGVSKITFIWSCLLSLCYMFISLFIAFVRYKEKSHINYIQFAFLAEAHPWEGSVNDEGYNQIWWGWSAQYLMSTMSYVGLMTTLIFKRCATWFSWQK